jgi:predicted nucleotidyltransferase
MLTDRDMTKMAQAIAERLAPMVVGIFGSYAVGTAGAGSDLDLFVIRDCTESFAMRRHLVRRALYHVMHRLDIHVFTPAEFEETARRRMSFAWLIARQARILHQSPHAAERLPSLAAKLIAAREAGSLRS